MFCALIAAGFCAKLLPAEWISGLLGEGSGFSGLIIAFLTGLLVPAGPVICFSIAAVFVKARCDTSGGDYLYHLMEPVWGAPPVHLRIAIAWL